MPTLRTVPPPPPPLAPHARGPKCLPTPLLPHHSTAAARLPVQSMLRLVGFFGALWRAIGFTMPRPLCCIMLRSEIIYREKPSEIACIASTQPLINAGCVIAPFPTSFVNPRSLRANPHSLKSNPCGLHLQDQVLALIWASPKA